MTAAPPLPDLVPEDLRLAIDATAIQAGLDPPASLRRPCSATSTWTAWTGWNC